MATCTLLTLVLATIRSVPGQAVAEEGIAAEERATRPHCQKVAATRVIVDQRCHSESNQDRTVLCAITNFPVPSKRDHA
ncbi:MAG: hypothetical protein ACREJN_04545 [Nitrospiraceae bacterium]